jgi:RNA polymerase sigma factor (sigma-70 family)
VKKLIIAASLAALFAGSALAETIKIGVTPAEHAQIMEQVKKVAATKGLDLEILEFSDYVVPNQALADGELQANSFQHQPYLDNQVADRKFDLVSVGTTITTPMGVYSKKVKSLDEMVDSGESAAIIELADFRDPLAECTDDSSRNAVRLAINRLPATYARILELRFGDELTVPEIARVLQLSESAAESRLSRARQAFRQEWAGAGHDAASGDRT